MIRVAGFQAATPGEAAPKFETRIIFVIEGMAETIANEHTAAYADRGSRSVTRVTTKMFDRMCSTAYIDEDLEVGWLLVWLTD